MDIATLHTVHAILSERGIRKASRLTGRPPASVSAALQRFEAALAAPLVRREGPLLVPTLEAQARMADLESARAAIAELLAPSSIAPVPAVGLTILRRFVAVVHERSIRAAARSSGTAQPQLTRDIARLERQIGYPLLLRSATGVTCTPEGIVAVGIAERLLDIWARLSRASADRFRKTAATWRLGAVIPFGHESDIAAMLARLTKDWMKERPRQPLFLSSTTADELIAGLKSRRFDVALIDVPDYPAEFEGALVARSGLALAGGPASTGTAVPDLAGMLTTHPIAVPSAKSGLRLETSRFLDRTLTDFQRSRLTMIEVDSIPVIINLVRNHGFLSVLPEASVANISTPPPLISLGPEHTQSLSLVWQKNTLSREAGHTMLRMMGHEVA